MFVSTAGFRWVTAGLLAAVALPAAAQKTTFNPRISLDQEYTDNVAVAGSTQTPESDSATRLTVSLPVEHEWQTGSFVLNYTPRYESYSTFSSLDNTSHRLRFDLSSEPSRGVTLRLRTSYDHTQNQARVDSLDDPELFVTQRTTRDLARLDFDIGAPMGHLWDWRANVGASDAQYERISGFEDTPTVEDRTQYRGGVRFDRQISRLASLGMSYDLQVNELEQSPGDTAHNLSFTVRRQVAKTADLDFAVGGYRREFDEPVDGSGSDTGFQTSLNLRKEYRNSRLRAGIRHRPASGGSLPGTSTDTALGLNADGHFARAWFWSGAARYAYRDPTDSAFSPVKTASAGATIERGFGKVFAVSLGANYTDQRGDVPEDAISYYRINLGLVAYPLGRSEIAR